MLTSESGDKKDYNDDAEDKDADDEHEWEKFMTNHTKIISFLVIQFLIINFDFKNYVSKFIFNIFSYFKSLLVKFH